MYTRPDRITKFIAILCVSVFTLTSIPLVTNASADDRDGRRARFSRDYSQRERHEKRYERAERRHERREYRAPRHDRWRDRNHVLSRPLVRHRHAIKHLPWGYKQFWYNRRPYFFGRGIFYEPYTGGFLAVRAPLGAIVVSLPIGYERLWVDGTAYYTYGGTYYRRVPAGYVVVDPPARIVVENNSREIVAPAFSASGRVIVDAPVLNVRSGPDLEEEKIFEIEEGAILEVSGKSDGWLYVQLPNGEFGWVKAVFTKPVTPGSG